jgi:hypothetical protein
MDPISAAIIAAVATGLVAPPIADAYQALKRLLTRHFGQDSGIVKAVNTLEEKPDSGARKSLVQEEVSAAEATASPEILAAAQELLARVKAAGGETPSITAISSGITGGGNIRQTAQRDAAGRDIVKNAKDDLLICQKSPMMSV